MLSQLRIRTRLLGGVVILIVLVIGLVIPFMLSSLNKASIRAETQQLQDLYFALMTTIDAQAYRAQALGTAVSHIPEIQSAFAERDRERLLAMTQPIFREMSREHALEQFQFHLPPATSFLRVHQPERFGDDLSSIRRTVVEANQERRAMRGLEVGVFGLGVRGVVPVAYEGRHLGTLEFGLSFGEAFFANFSEQFSANAALHIQRNGRIESYAGTIRGEARFDQQALSAIMRGEPQMRRLMHQDRPVVVYAQAIQDYAGTPFGVLEVMLDRTDNVAYYRQAVVSGVGIGAVALILGLIGVWWLAQGIVKPLCTAAERLNAISSGDGDLTQRLPVSGQDELSDLSRAFNLFVDKIQDLVQDIVRATAQLNTAAEQLFAISGDTTQRVMRQQSETDQVATAMNEMTSTVQDVARSANDAARSAQQADEEAAAGRSVVNKSIESINHLANEIEDAAGVIGRLSTDSEDIGKVLDVIRGIAEQTNLLALNAAIEAARAGEQGRGFAVVADEVRTLASRTQASTQEIQQMIQRLQENASSAVTAMEQGRGQARASVTQASLAGDSLAAITRSVATISDMNTQIASAAEEQSAVSEEINRNVVNISQAVDGTADGMTRISQSSEALRDLAVTLRNKLGRFKA